MMQDILVTIGIPAFNSGEYISKTIESILNQSYTNIEILISDNGSTDNTQSIILDYVKKDHRIKYLRNKTTISYSENCNKIISLSNGSYIGIYHSDDIYDQNIVEKEIQALKKFPDISGVFTLYEYIDENDNQIKPVRYPILFNEDFFRVDFKNYVNTLIEKGGSCFCCPTSMIKKDVYLKLNGYNNQLNYIEDQDMWLRILMSGDMLILKDKLIKYRIHAAQGSSIYKNSERKSIALPIIHLKSFLKKNNLFEEYRVKINIAEAKDSLSLALLAVKRDDYNDYIYWVSESKKKYTFNFFNKYGFVQKSPNKKIIYFLLKFYTQNV